MKMQVVNQTESDINIGGEIIPPSNSITLHKSFIQDETLEKLKENFNIDAKTQGLMIIKDLEIDVDVDVDVDVNPGDEKDVNPGDETAKFYAYPKSVIKANGSLSGSVGKKKIIKALDDLGLTFLDDNEFKAKHPELDIEEYRYKG